MCYWLPASIMKDGVAVVGGTNIDAMDAQFAASVYPRFANWQLLDNNPATADIVATSDRLYQMHNTGRIRVYSGTPPKGAGTR